MTYFSDLSALLKEDIAPIFDQVVNEILKTMNADEQLVLETNDSTPSKSKKDFSLDTDSEDEAPEQEVDTA